MSEVYGGEDLPEGHPLAGANVPESHAEHLDELGAYLEDADPEDIRMCMLIVTTEDSTETIPTMQEGCDFEDLVWFQLAAHISHVAATFEADPLPVAQHACHVLEDNLPDSGGASE